MRINQPKLEEAMRKLNDVGNQPHAVIVIVVDCHTENVEGINPLQTLSFGASSNAVTLARKALEYIERKRAIHGFEDGEVNRSVKHIHYVGCDTYIACTGLGNHNTEIITRMLASLLFNDPKLRSGIHVTEHIEELFQGVVSKG